MRWIRENPEAAAWGVVASLIASYLVRVLEWLLPHTVELGTVLALHCALALLGLLDWLSGAARFVASEPAAIAALTAMILSLVGPPRARAAFVAGRRVVIAATRRVARLRAGDYGRDARKSPPMDGRLERLRAGREHGSAVATNLIATSRELESCVAERTLVGRDGRGRPRADLFSVMQGVDEGGERIVVIDEIKNSDWSRMAPHRVRPNVLRYARQLWRYIEAQQSAEFRLVMAAIHFPLRPSESRAAEIEACFEEAGISVVWA